MIEYDDSEQTISKLEVLKVMNVTTTLVCDVTLCALVDGSWT